jgi:hypothetical protein
MLTTIGRNYAPDFDGVHLQGVHGDSLESFRPIGEVQGGEMLVLRAFCARSIGNYIICIVLQLYA